MVVMPCVAIVLLCTDRLLAYRLQSVEKDARSAHSASRFPPDTPLSVDVTVDTELLTSVSPLSAEGPTTTRLTYIEPGRHGAPGPIATVRVPDPLAKGLASILHPALLQNVSTDSRRTHSCSNFKSG